MVATGDPAGDTGGRRSHRFRNGLRTCPNAVAGFNFSRFEKAEAIITDPTYTLQAFVEQRPRRYCCAASFGHASPVNTMIKKALGEEQLAIPLYTEFYGPTPFGRLAVTQQTAPTYGQSWPELVFLPITSFLDDAARALVGFREHRFFDRLIPMKLRINGGGRPLTGDSYRDQWMSEGFAELLASLFSKHYTKVRSRNSGTMREKMLLEKDAGGLSRHRRGAGDAGIPAGLYTSGLQYSAPLDISEGRLRPQHNPHAPFGQTGTGDPNFKKMMHDFVQSYSRRAATTEDFKATIEK